MYILYFLLLMLTCFIISLCTTSCTRYGKLGMQKLDEISVTDAIIGRKELDVAENVYKNYFRKASGSNIGAQIYNTCTYINIYRTLNKTPSE